MLYETIDCVAEVAINIWEITKHNNNNTRND